MLYPSAYCVCVSSVWQILSPAMSLMFEQRYKSALRICKPDIEPHNMDTFCGILTCRMQMHQKRKLLELCKTGGKELKPPSHFPIDLWPFTYYLRVPHGSLPRVPPFFGSPKLLALAPPEIRHYYRSQDGHGATDEGAIETHVSQGMTACAYCFAVSLCHCVTVPLCHRSHV